MRRELDLAVVILNYRTPTLVVDCLATLAEQLIPGREKAVVVDNASGDDSVAHVRQAVVDNQWGDWVEVIASADNGGFSAGNNMGMRAVDAAAYFLTNSDTLVRPGALAALRDALAKHPEAGLISPRLEWPDGTPQISCFRYRSPIAEFVDAAHTGVFTRLLRRYDVPLPLSDVPIRPQWTTFASIVLRREVLDAVGEMDEGYFMYFEDVDYCRRARNAGWDILHWPAARVVHLRGGSSQVKSATAARKRRPGYYYAARSRYLAKFYGRWGFWLANFLWWDGRLISKLRELLGNKAPHVCEREWLDIWKNGRDPLTAPARDL